MNFFFAASSVSVLLAIASTASYAQTTVVRIGHVAATSGPLASSGKSIENAARLAVEDLNAKNIAIGEKKARFELIAEDDAADPKQATAVAQKFVDSNVNAVIGHQTSGTSIPASREYSKAGIPQISVAATNPKYTRQGYKTTFRVVADDAQLGRALAKFSVSELKAKVVAVIDDRTAYGQGIADEYAKAVSEAGASLARREYTSDKATDLSAILTSIKAVKPDVIFFGGMYSVAGPMIKQIKQLGLSVKVVGGDGICTEELPKIAGDAIGERMVYCGEAAGTTAAQAAAVSEFNQRYKKRYGMDSEIFATNAYDAVGILAAAMQAAKSADPEKYLPALAATKGYKGLTGEISFDEKGDLKNGTVTLYTISTKGRQKVTVVQ